MAKQIDSRRLPGASLFGERPGAILDVRLEGEDPGALVETWVGEARRVLHAVGWSSEVTAARLSGADLSLYLSAPCDALYAATEVNELAWACAEAILSGSPEPELEPGLTEVRTAIAGERNPRWVALRDEAARRGVACIADDHRLSLGMGRGSVTFEMAGLPSLREVPWERIHDVPAVLVTGTNGKSTTVRLLGAIVGTSGKTSGISTTDGLRVGSETIGSGDYSGPEGARKILRDPRVEVAVLETARGGIQRRGLVIPRVDAAAITNVAEDHLGEFGIHGLDDIAAVKWVVARAVKPGGTLVVNGDDPRLSRGHPELVAKVVAFTASDAASLLDVHAVPVTFGGVAKHNVANAMTAALLAKALEIDDATIAAGLASFRGLPDENPGRLNLIELGGVRLLIDYAHNPHGMDALVAVAASLPASRRLLMIGQAGDRDDDALRALARSGYALAPDAIVIKEMADYLRGRAPGEIPRILEDEFLKLGARRERLLHASSEVDGVKTALGWAKPGDLLVLPTHSNRREVLDLIDRLGRTGWTAGRDLPV
jgi:UDP-N-acetylmuramyl tripeptide synthase